MSRMIDLRSDTVTQPTPGMRRAMAEAVVGDDVFEGDPTVQKLESRVAELFGKEASLFVASGTMGNQVCLKTWSNPGEETLIVCSDTLTLCCQGWFSSLIADIL